MGDVLEVSPSGRAKCRGCKESIAKGEVRFGEQFESAFAGGEALRYWHLMCAAGKLPARLKAAMATYEGDIPNRAEVEAALAAPPKKGGRSKEDVRYPYAEAAPTGRARCMVCGEALEKGTLRVAVERETETPSGMPVRGAGYLHPACAMSWVEDQGEDPEGFVEKLFAQSTLDDAQRDALMSAFDGAEDEDAD